MKRYALAAVCGIFFFTMGAPLTHADFGTPSIERAVSILMAPAHPRPGDTVHLSAESALIDIKNSDIVWYKNGTQLLGGQGIDSVDITAGKLGSRIDVKVVVTGEGGATASAQTAIVPAEVDLLYGADSYTPPFYRGRALPSGGTTLRLLAVARLKRPGERSAVPAGDIVYTWRQDGQVLGSLSGRARSLIIIPSPFPRSANVISVEAQDVKGAVSAAASVRIPAVLPALRLYEDHPLFGVRYGNALGTTTTLSESEMTFAAVPYFASVQRAGDALLSYDWTVNGRAVQTSGSAKNEIAIGGTRGTVGESARITLSVSHATNAFLDTTGGWNIVLSGIPNAEDAFRRAP